MTVADAEDGLRPWPPKYKIRPHEKDRLTAADVVGPDGIVYPDWRYAGVPGGIPEVAVVARLAEFGGRPDDGLSDSDALACGVAAVASAGGGALLLDTGVYHLDRPVVIAHDAIVIRGAGPGKTQLIFRYSPPKDGVVFFAPADGDVLGPDSLIEIHAFPDELEKISLTCDGREIASRQRHEHWGGTFQLTASGGRLLGRVGPGKHTLTAGAEWTGGRRSESTIEIELERVERRSVDADAANVRQSGREYPWVLAPVGRPAFVGNADLNSPHGLLGKGAAALEFVGDMPDGPRWRLDADGERGDTVLQLKETPNLAPGDCIVLEAPATQRWNQLFVTLANGATIGVMNSVWRRFTASVCT